MIASQRVLQGLGSAAQALDCFLVFARQQEDVAKVGLDRADDPVAGGRRRVDRGQHFALH